MLTLLFLPLQARGGWKEGQKMDDLRRVYQRAVSIPLNNVETIWREYDQYENGLNKITVRAAGALSFPLTLLLTSI